MAVERRGRGVEVLADKQRDRNRASGFVRESKSSTHRHVQPQALHIEVIQSWLAKIK